MKKSAASRKPFKRLGSVLKSRKKPVKSKPKVVRSHKSFRLTKRADYTRKLELPGYILSTIAPFRLIWSNKKLFASFLVLYSLVSLAIVGLASQETYNQVADAVDVVGQSFDLQAFGQAMTLAFAGITGGFSGTDLNSSGPAAGLLFLISWLTVIWLTRALMRGEKPRLRDGLYNSGSPIVPVAVLVFVGLVQVIPAAIAVLVLRAGIATGFIVTGIEGMLIAVPVVLAIALSLYWLTTTIMSVIVVTLPGMYPLNAHRHAYNLIRGRRITVVLRLVWMAVVQVLIWIAVLTPAILIERALQPHIGWFGNVPAIPLLVLVLTSISLVYIAIYSYQLYRNIVDYDAR